MDIEGITHEPPHIPIRCSFDRYGHPGAGQGCPDAGRYLGLAVGQIDVDRGDNPKPAGRLAVGLLPVRGKNAHIEAIWQERRTPADLLKHNGENHDLLGLLG